MKEVLARIVDESRFDEYKPEYGKTLLCGYARIGGFAVGIVANQKLHAQQTDHEGHKRMEFGGVIYTESAEKAARFIMDCNQNLVPLVFFHDVSGFMVGRDAEWSGIIKAGAKMVNAVANSVVPKIVVIVGGSFGAGHYAMCGKAYDPRFVFAWPTARYAVMSGESAAGTLRRNQSEAARTQRQEVERRREERAVRRGEENLHRADRPALRRRPPLDRQDHRPDGNPAGDHAGARSRSPEPRRARVQGGGPTDMIHHGDTEARSKLLHEELTEKVIGAAIEVHRALGPGLLESAYEECLCRELDLRGLAFQRQVPLPVEYKGVKLDCGYRLDLVVQEAVILELKCVDHILPVHEAQLFTYLKLTGKRIGLIINFNVAVLVRGGIVRKVL